MVLREDEILLRNTKLELKWDSYLAKCSSISNRDASFRELFPDLPFDVHLLDAE